MTDEQLKEFQKAAEPLIKYLAENYNPHTTCIVTNNSAEMLQGIAGYTNNEHLRD